MFEKSEPTPSSWPHLAACGKNQIACHTTRLQVKSDGFSTEPAIVYGVVRGWGGGGGGGGGGVWGLAGYTGNSVVRFLLFLM